MSYEKGNVKKGGRKAGVPNKSTQVKKAFVEYILTKGEEDIDNLWDELRAKDKMDAIIKLMEFALPKLGRIETTHKAPSNITINLLPASPEKIAEQNTIDISHEEVDPPTGDKPTD